MVYNNSTLIHKVDYIGTLGPVASFGHDVAQILQ